jgi:hypothetical protein
MAMVKKTLFALVLLVAALVCNGCFNVHVKEDVDFPGGLFAAAWEKLAVMEKHNPDRIGRSAKMHVLVYDGKCRELVRVTLPMWMAKMAEKNKKRSSRAPAQDVAGRYVDFDLSDLGDISRMGPGLLVQVEDMRENTHVLVWLE